MMTSLVMIAEKNEYLLVMTVMKDPGKIVIDLLQVRIVIVTGSHLVMREEMSLDVMTVTANHPVMTGVVMAVIETDNRERMGNGHGGRLTVIGHLLAILMTIGERGVAVTHLEIVIHRPEIVMIENAHLRVMTEIDGETDHREKKAGVTNDLMTGIPGVVDHLVMIGAMIMMIVVEVAPGEIVTTADLVILGATVALGMMVEHGGNVTTTEVLVMIGVSVMTEALVMTGVSVMTEALETIGVTVMTEVLVMIGASVMTKVLVMIGASVMTELLVMMPGGREVMIEALMMTEHPKEMEVAGENHVMMTEDLLVRNVHHLEKMLGDDQVRVNPS